MRVDAAPDSIRHRIVATQLAIGAERCDGNIERVYRPRRREALRLFSHFAERGQRDRYEQGDDGNNCGEGRKDGDPALEPEVSDGAGKVACRAEKVTELAAGGPEFDRRVWKALLDIPFGTTTSYGAVAKRIGYPTAARAVGAANGDIRVMADQVKRGIAWVYKNAASFGGDPNRLYLCGQSSGAHLSGVALVTDWQKDFALPADLIKGGVLLSGMYEMKPVRLSARAKYVKFDDAMEESMSTIRHIERLRAPLVLLYGTNETPEFQRQTRDFAAAVKAAGKPVQLIVAPNHNHYELQETMANPYGWGGRAALAMMGLGAGLLLGVQRFRRKLR